MYCIFSKKYPFAYFKLGLIDQCLLDSSSLHEHGVFNIKLGFLFITVKRHISFHYNYVPKITPGINARGTFL